jgi:hypothetical protein
MTRQLKSASHRNEAIKQGENPVRHDPFMSEKTRELAKNAKRKQTLQSGSVKTEEEPETKPPKPLTKGGLLCSDYVAQGVLRESRVNSIKTKVENEEAPDLTFRPTLVSTAAKREKADKRRAEIQAAKDEQSEHRAAQVRKDAEPEIDTTFKYQQKVPKRTAMVIDFMAYLRDPLKKRD